MRIVADTDTVSSGGNPDLLTLREYQGIPILSTTAALALVAERDH
jgi:hypothetical protein